MISIVIVVATAASKGDYWGTVGFVNDIIIIIIIIGIVVEEEEEERTMA